MWIAVGSTLVNLAFAAGNFLIGWIETSWWYLSLGVYYLILCLIRGLIICLRTYVKDQLISRLTGSMLMVTALPLLGIAILSAVRDTGHRFHTIVMITLALYTFTKITIAIINLCKVRSSGKAWERALRNISFADALVSIASLQRSMLVTYEGMTVGEIRLFNLLTGIGVCMVIFILGLSLFSEIFTKRKQGQII